VVEQGFTALLDRVRSTGRAHIARRDKVVLRNGPDREEERYLDFIYQPILSPDGEISGIFVQGHDVTDQVEAEAHQQLLINELNHRVKNTLAIVQGLASQSFRRGTVPEEGQVAFFARLSALAAAHNLLTKGNWGAANLAEMVRAGIGGLAGANLDRIGIAGPKVCITAQLATSVAMVIHELSTNAFKYGALSRNEGRVDIRWSVQVDQGAQLLAFDWTESGGPRLRNLSDMALARG
jgi:two-component sensor histidine kinase